MHVHADIQEELNMPDGGCTSAALATNPSTCMSLLSAGDMMQACFKLYTMTISLQKPLYC